MNRFGARLMWSAALGLFLLGSVLSGMAWSAGALVAFRVLQGLGGGVILPLTQLILARAAGPHRLGRVMSVVGLAVLPAGVVALVYALSSLGSGSAAAFQHGTIMAAGAGTVLLAVGMAVAGAGTIPFAFAKAESDTRLPAVALLVRGIGVGIVGLPITVALYRTLAPAAIPGATTAGHVLQRIGAATGTALMAVILQSSGFAVALAWMLVLTVVGMVGTVLLPGSGEHSDRVANAPAS